MTNNHHTPEFSKGAAPTLSEPPLKPNKDKKVQNNINGQDKRVGLFRFFLPLYYETKLIGIIKQLCTIVYRLFMIFQYY